MINLQNHILDIQHGIKSNRFSNKASISQGIVLRLLQALSWPTYDIQIVFPNFIDSGKRVDYALCNPQTKPTLFIALIQNDQQESKKKQLIEFAFDVDVPMAILTDGQVWRFFLTTNKNHYQERHFHKLDMLEHSVDEIVQYLQRYLAYDAVCSGKALENAHNDYNLVSKEHQIRTTLPIAWSMIVEEQDDSLVTLIADKVENLSGHKPSADTVSDYLASLQDRKIFVTDSQNISFAVSKTRKVIYWLFVTIPIILHVTINLYFWQNQLNFKVNTQSEEFLYWIKFIWFTPVIWVILNFLGLLHGPPKDVNSATIAQWTWGEANSFLIVSYVSKGINQETLFRAMRETQEILVSKSVRYLIEVVTDIEITWEHRISANNGSIHYYVVPEDYQTETKVKYKARALQYLLEQRKNRLNRQNDFDINDAWILHLDEESVLTPQAIVGIEKFIRKYSLHHGKGAIGQGEILYNSYKYGKHILFNAADAIRTGDDLGRFRYQYKVLNKPVGGMHGSFVLIPAVIEQKISWDSGTKSQITEDAHFALRAMEKNIRFDWVDGFIKEQSPFTIRDFINQRTRWYSGLTLLVTDTTLKLASRLVLGIILFSWSIAWIGTFVTILNFFISLITREVFFPRWAILATSLLSGLIGSIYMVGSYRNVTYWVAPIWKKIAIVLTTYILFLFQVLPLLEGIAVVNAIYRKIFKPLQEFHVIDKD